MKINLTKAQYKNLILMNSLATSILGILKDSSSNEEYAVQSQKMDELEGYLLQFANDFDCSEFAESDGGKTVFSNDLYEKLTVPIMNDYGEFEALQTLANKLAWRDFMSNHSAKEIEEMAKENGGYFGVEIEPYEKKYWDEFEKNGYKRMEIGG